MLNEFLQGGNNVSCMIRDCMFEFRSLDIPTCTYKEMASLMIGKTVIPIAKEYADRDRHFTLIQTFDRRADLTKGCTEITRASVPVSPLEYSGIQVDEKELIKSYKTRWLDRDFGRQKIITSYVRSCQQLEFLRAKNLPHNFTHIIIGGNCGISAAYTVDCFGKVTISLQDYTCHHAEADTVVFFALRQFLRNNSDVGGSSIIIHCPEADNITILLLEHKLIEDIVRRFSIHLFCSVHNKLVDAKTKQPTKKAKETASIEDFKESASKIRMNFYINVVQLYQNITLSDSFENTPLAIESLGAISIFTGNDKNPGVRNITKAMALNVYQEACKEGILSSLVDNDNAKLLNNNYCRDSFLLFYARLYFFMYRVLIRKLGNITWDLIALNGEPNFKLLRDIGCQYSKGQLDKLPPVDGALKEIFKRSVFQANEYDQVFERTITYLDPLKFGFEAYKRGLRPVLNSMYDPDPNSQIVINNIHEALVNSGLEKESGDLSCACFDIEPEANNQQCDELNISNSEYQELVDSFLATVDNEQCFPGALNSHILDDTIEHIHDEEDNLEGYEETLTEFSQNDNYFDSFHIGQWFQNL